MTPEVQVSDGLAITLSHISPTDDWVAVSVVVTHVDRRHRITFSSERPVEEVLCPEIADLLMPILKEFGDISEIYSNPDTQINLPGLSLAQLRVIFSKHEDGRDRALVRFASFKGNPHRALTGDDSFAYPMEALTTQVYRDALDWVLMPALNIASIDEVTGFEAEDTANVSTALTNLREAKDQLMFQVELVKRELGRLESHSYAKRPDRRVLLAAEPPQEDFRTLRVIREMD